MALIVIYFIVLDRKLANDINCLFQHRPMAQIIKICIFIFTPAFHYLRTASYLPRVSFIGTLITAIRFIRMLLSF